MVTNTKPQQWMKGKSERLRGDKGDQSKFIEASYRIQGSKEARTSINCMFLG